MIITEREWEQTRPPKPTRHTMSDEEAIQQFQFKILNALLVNGGTLSKTEIHSRACARSPLVRRKAYAKCVSEEYVRLTRRKAEGASNATTFLTITHKGIAYLREQTRRSKR